MEGRIFNSVTNASFAGWKCCKPRVLTFDEFLSITPCTTGKHSTTDIPPEVEKKQGADASSAPAPSQKVDAPVPGRQPVAAPQTIATPPPPPPESEDDDPSLAIPKGKTCRRRACGGSYEGDESRKGEKCVFHPGAPIFHEGSKGYTCCKRRVLEFDEFMKIEGCATRDRHLFVGSGGKNKKANEGGEEVVETVRNDFYQTATSVIASFFLKKINKDDAKVEFQEKSVELDLRTTDTPVKRYKTSVPLFGPINTEKSSFKIMGTKLEVNLAKGDGSSWPVLRSDDPRSGEVSRAYSFVISACLRVLY